jgi:shikimate kinase
MRHHAGMRSEPTGERADLAVTAGDDAAPALPRPLALVGMMGSGKSTVGKRLARALGRPFVDMDAELERRCGVPIHTIFELEGEEGFRRRESNLLQKLCQATDLVLATGGGVVLREDNRALLRAHTRVIYLQAALQDLWIRLRHDRSRPLLRSADPRARLAELLAAREPIYREVADLSVTTGQQAPERVVNEILGCLGLHRALEPSGRWP